MEFEEKRERMLECICKELTRDEFMEGLISKVRENTKKIRIHDNYFKIIVGIIVVLTAIFALVESLRGYYLCRKYSLFEMFELFNENIEFKNLIKTLHK
jgi:hypothetical protein